VVPKQGLGSGTFSWENTKKYKDGSYPITVIAMVMKTPMKVIEWLEKKFQGKFFSSLSLFLIKKTFRESIRSLWFLI